MASSNNSSDIALIESASALVCAAISLHTRLNGEQPIDVEGKFRRMHKDIHDPVLQGVFNNICVATAILDELIAES